MIKSAAERSALVISLRQRACTACAAWLVLHASHAHLVAYRGGAKLAAALRRCLTLHLAAARLRCARQPRVDAPTRRTRPGTLWLQPIIALASGDIRPANACAGAQHDCHTIEGNNR